MIEIPEDAYPRSESQSQSYTGLPDYAKPAAQNLLNRLPGLMDSFSGSIKRLEDEGPALVDDWLKGSTDAYGYGLNQVGDWLREPVNRLASKGLWDSTLARDAVIGLGRGLSDDYTQFFGDTAKRGEEMKLNIAQNIPTLWGAAAQTGLGGLSASREGTSTSESSSEDPLARYTEMLSLLI